MTTKQKKTPKQPIKSSKKQWSISDFDIGKPLGKGKFGRMYLAPRNQEQVYSGVEVVFKEQIDKYRLHHQLCREMEIQTGLRHPNVLRGCTGWFHDNERSFLILEYAHGGDYIYTSRFIEMRSQKTIAED